MSAGEEIAADVRAALIEAGEATGNDAGFYCVLRKDTPGAAVATDPVEAETLPVSVPQDTEILALQDTKKVRDKSGTLTGVTHRMLVVESIAGVVPVKSDTIAIGIRLSEVSADTHFEEIYSVEPLQPTGVAILYEIMLKD